MRGVLRVAKLSPNYFPPESAIMAGHKVWPHVRPFFTQPAEAECLEGDVAYAESSRTLHSPVHAQALVLVHPRTWQWTLAIREQFGQTANHKLTPKMLRVEGFHSHCTRAQCPRQERVKECFPRALKNILSQYLTLVVDT